MVEEGIVSALGGSKIVIDVRRHSACATCGLCAKNERRMMQVEAENSVKARIGDKVLLHLDESIFLKGALIVYVLPLASLLTGLFTGVYLAGFAGLVEFRELVGAAFGAAFLVLSFFAIRRLSLKNRGNFSPTVTLAK